MSGLSGGVGGGELWCEEEGKCGISPLRSTAVFASVEMTTVRLLSSSLRQKASKGGGRVGVYGREADSSLWLGMTKMGGSEWRLTGWHIRKGADGIGAFSAVAACGFYQRPQARLM